MRHPVFYEINTRCWLAELSEKAGKVLTLADVPESEFDSWRSRGFTHIWLMGVWTLGRRGLAHSRKAFSVHALELQCSDIVGSPYAIAGYTVSRRLGGELALAVFRRKLDARGIKLVLDFVPNHTAMDHPWVRTHPHFYLTSDRKRAGTARPFRGATRWFAHGHCGFGEPWVDTLQLDYREPALRRAMIDELLAVSRTCDGVRCDMAMLALNNVFAQTWREFPSESAAVRAEFWTEAIAAVRQRQEDFLFVAEVYWDLEQRLQELGFDFTYDKRLYDRLLARNTEGVVQYLQSLSSDFLNRSVHFIENHDEPRIASLLSLPEHCAAALLIMTLPGARFLHEGQMTGARVHANVHFARRGAENVDEPVRVFYERLFAALQKTAVGRGDWKLLAPRPAAEGNPAHNHLVVVQWREAPEAFDLAVINLAPVRGQCLVPLDFRDPTSGAWRLIDLLGDEVHERSAVELARGLYLDLPAHGAQLFHCQRIRP